ncbi:ricin-type beta-trefoil lectin domain protein [Streptomyces sp. NPDC090106]|uniref:ricin-type beta-trefoil lectin domain protein n=1 Tax=Streptomyces sp. NPDC090106 TaxID=3365946 RepID=UPI00381E2706
MTRGGTARTGDTTVSSPSGLAVAAEPPETDSVTEPGSPEPDSPEAVTALTPSPDPAGDAPDGEPTVATGASTPTPVTSSTVTPAGGSLRSTADEDDDTDAGTPDVDTDTDTDADSDADSPDADADAQAGTVVPTAVPDSAEGRPEAPGATAEGSTAGADETVALISDTGREGDDGDAETGGRRISRESVIGVSVLALLVAGSSFLLLGSGDGSSASDTVESARGGFSQDDEGGAGGVPGAAASTAPSASPRTGARPSAGASTSPRSAAVGPVSATGKGSGHSGPGATTGKAATGAGAAAAADDQPAKSTAATPTAGQTAAAASAQSTGSLVGAASGRCVDVTDGTAGAGTALQIWDCTGATWQRWSFYSDGTVRSLGLCMEVASAGDGAAMRLAKCNAGSGQRFQLNSAGDLVNLKADKCVDVKDQLSDNGTRLQLWTCTGAQNQKWSMG